MARYDRVIRGGMIVDGSRLPRFRGDIGIKDGRIAEIGQIAASEADDVIDAGGNQDLVHGDGGDDTIDLGDHHEALGLVQRAAQEPAIASLGPFVWRQEALLIEGVVHAH